MQELSGKVAVITGGASGIGLAMAHRFAAAGMKIVIGDRDASALAEVAGMLRDQGANAEAVEIDVTRPADMCRLADSAYHAFGAVHLLCNNAGVLGRVLSSWRQPLENWQWVFDVNVKGVVHGIHYFVPRMIEQGEEGYVLNTGSIAGLICGPYYAPYNASKHAVVAISECLHYELRESGAKLEVGVLCPGWVNTGLADLDKKLPSSLRGANDAVDTEAGAQRREENVRRMISASNDPDFIAAAVEEGVREGRFYILPHPERKADVERRMWDVIQERVPVFGAPPQNGS